LIFLLDPNHVRANSNKISYETIIKNQTLTINKDKTYEIKNQRPDDDDDEDLEEREIYEALCRQNETEVKSNVRCKSSETNVEIACDLTEHGRNSIVFLSDRAESLD